MSKQVEHVVVQMEFNNAQFEKGTKETMSTLDRLKEKLKFEGIQNGLSKVSSEIKKVDMTPLNNAVEKTRTSFSMLEVVALGALANIGATMSTKLINVLKEFTLDPIMQGFSEYELKLNSTQTIMSATGESIDVVNGYLERLNEYSDKTIYSFSDMTESIAKFTNAGVSLETAVNSIQGIANAAALAGAGTRQASSAMYNFSQAISTGYMALTDWKSIELAGIATKSFKEELIATAVEMGTLVQVEGGYVSTTTNLLGKTSDLLTATTGWNASLQHQWMTADVLTATLSKYSDETTELGQSALAAAQDVRSFSMMMDALKEQAQSGWAKTWEILFGNIEDSKKLWTPISNALGGIISGIDDFRNKVLQTWADLGGKSNLIEGLGRAFKNLGDIFKAVGNAFKNVFSGFTGEHLKTLTDGFVKLLDSLALGENTIKNIQTAFEVLFKILKTAGTVILAPFQAALPILVALIGKLRDAFEFVAVYINKATDKLKEFFKSSDGASSFLDKLVSSLKMAADRARQFIEDFDMEQLHKYIKMMEPYIEMAKDKLIEMGEKAKDVAIKVSEAFKEMDWAAAKSKMVSTIQKITDKVELVFLEMKVRVTNTINKIKEFIEGIPWNEIIKFLTGIGIGKIMLDIASFLKGIGEAFSSFGGVITSVSGVVDSIKEIFEGVGDSLEAFQTRLKAEALKSLAIAIGILAASIFLLSRIEPTTLAIALGGITAMMGALIGMSVAINKWGGEINGMFAVAAAIAVLVASVKSIGELEPMNLALGLGAIVALLAALAGYNVIMKKYADDLKQGSLSIIAMATAMRIIVEAVEEIANLNPQQAAIGVTSVAALIVTMATAMKKIPSSEKDTVAGALKLVAFGAALVMLGNTVEDLGKLKWEELAKGLVGVGTLLLEFAALAAALDHVNTDMTKASTALLILAAALTALIVPVTILAKMSWTTIADGLTKVALLLTTLATALKLMPEKNLKEMGVMLLEVAAAMTIMAAAVKMMSGMTWEEIAKGLTVLAGSLTALAIALKYMNGCYAGASALIQVATAITILAVAMNAFALIEPNKIATSLITLASSLGIMVVAVAALAPFSLWLPTISTAMIAFGTAAALGGVGALAFASALVLLESSVAGMGAVLAAALAAVIAAAPQITEALSALLLAALRALRDIVPELVDTLMDILVRVTNSLANNIGPLVENLVQILISIVNAVRKYLPAIIDAAIGVLVELFAGIMDRLKQIDFSTLLDAIVGAGLFTAFLTALIVIQPLIPVAMKALVQFGILIAEFIALLAVIGGIAQIPGVSGILKDGGGILKTIGDAIGGFLGSIIGGFAGGVIDGVASTLPKVGECLSGFANNAKPFFEIVTGLSNEFPDKIMTLMTGITGLTASGALDALTKIFTGSSGLIKIGQELCNFAPYLKEFVEEISSVDPSKIADTSVAMNNLAQMAENMPREGGIWGFLAGDRDYAAFGKQLKDLGKGLADYSNAVVNVDSGRVKNSVEAAKHIVNLAQEIPNSGGVAGFFAGENDLSGLATQLVPFGKALSEYSNTVTNISVDKVKASADAALSLVQMLEEMPNDGGLVSWFTGDNTLDELGKQLAVFGYGLSSYSDSVANVNAAKIKESAEATKSLITMSNNLSNEGGIVSWFTGDNTLGDFGKELTKFGSNLSTYSTTLEGVNLENIRKGTDCSNLISQMAKNVTTGDIRLASYTEDIVDLGEALLSFSNDVAVVALSDFQIVITNIENVTKACSKLASVDVAAIRSVGDSVQDSIRDMIDGTLEVIALKLPDYTQMGKDLITRLCTGMKNQNASMNATATKLGSDLIQYFRNGIGQKVSTIDTEIKNLITRVSNTITSANSNMSSWGSSWMSNLSSGIRSGSSNVSSAISSVCGATANTAKSYYSSMYSVGSYLVQGLVNGIKNQNASIRATATKAGGDMIQAFRDAIKSKVSTIDQSFKDLITTVKRTLSSATSDFRSVGADWMAKLKSGVDSGKSSVSSSISGVCGGLANTVRSYYSSMYSAGSYLVQGLVNGINAYSYQAYYAAAYMAESAAQAAREALRINSPSKVFEEIGKFIDMGLAQGMTKYSNLSDESAKSVAEQTADNMRNSLSQVLTEEIDLDPVIRPVLDLTNVQNGVGYMNSMFDKSLAINGSTRLANSISNSMNNRVDKSLPNVSNNTNNTEIINHFNITGDNAKDIANEVSRILQKQMERRDAVWA